MTTTIYGIKNCDTMKKALRWLDDHGLEYSFHDYKKEGVNQSALIRAIAEHGWEVVINQRGTTWRQLPDETKESMDHKNALLVAEENSSIIKRPLLIHQNRSYLGFKPAQYEEIFS